MTLKPQRFEQADSKSTGLSLATKDAVDLLSADLCRGSAS
jgi:hypothetical protein